MHSSKPTVLIVEPDEATRELYTRALSRDYCVVASADSHDALALLQNDAIRAVVLEPSAADDSGWQMLATLRAHHATLNIPVILCSVLDERRRGMDLGAVAYLIKPVLPARLLEALHAVMEPRNATAS